MTRAQFAAIVVRALGLTPACQRGLYRRALHRMVCPLCGDRPAPTASSTAWAKAASTRTAPLPNRRPPSWWPGPQNSAVWTRRWTPPPCRDVLAQFTDYVTTPEWAREGLAFCYQEGILDDSAMEIQGKTEILRCEIAQMLYNLLSSAKLL